MLSRLSLPAFPWPAHRHILLLLYAGAYANSRPVCWGSAKREIRALYIFMNVWISCLYKQSNWIIITTAAASGRRATKTWRKCRQQKKFSTSGRKEKKSDKNKYNVVTSLNALNYFGVRNVPSLDKSKWMGFVC